MSNWEQQYIQITKTLDEIKCDVRANKEEVSLLKQETATGKGALRAVTWIGSVLIIIFTTLKLLRY